MAGSKTILVAFEVPGDKEDTEFVTALRSAIFEEGEEAEDAIGWLSDYTIAIEAHTNG